MLLHDAPRFRIFFGGKNDSVSSPVVDTDHFLDSQPLRKVGTLLHADQFFFAHQTHSADGYVVMQDIFPDHALFKKDGDFLVSNSPGMAIGVLTADCLPIVLYDPVFNVVSVVHAGWRGSAAGVAVSALEKMGSAFGTQPGNVQVFFGPAAGICCYQVGADFVKNFENYPYAHYMLQRHGMGYFFDLAGFNRQLLITAGIKKDAFHEQYNICTICDLGFCSYRREAQESKRQLTVVALK